MASPAAVPTTKKFDRSKNSVPPEKFDPSKNADAPKRNEHLDAKLEEFLRRDAQFQANTVQNTIECALNVKAAHDLFRNRINAHYWELFERQSYHASDISMYLAIANNKHLTDKANRKFLPAGVSVLYYLARLTQKDTPAEFKKWLKKPEEPECTRSDEYNARRSPCGKIHPNITRTQANDLLATKLGRPTSAEKRVAKIAKPSNPQLEYEIGQLKEHYHEAGDLLYDYYPEKRVDNDANLLMDYLRSLDQQFADGKIDEPTHFGKMSAVLAGSNVAHFAALASRIKDYYHETLRFGILMLTEVMQYSINLHKRSFDLFHLQVSSEEMEAAEQELIAFAASENRKYRRRRGNDINLNVEDGVLERYVDTEFLNDVQLFLKEWGINDLEIEINIRRK